MDSQRTKQLRLECVREFEQQRKEEREDWIVAIVGAVACIGLVFILAQVIQ